MARSHLLPFSVGSLILLAGVFATTRADNPNSPDEVLEKQVKVQMLIMDGNHLLLVDNNPAKAVEVLEKNLHLIDGNKAYLLLLRNAYKKHIVNLFLSSQTALAQKYLGRLRILDPDGADQLLSNPAASLTKAGTATQPVAVPLNPLSGKQPFSIKPAVNDAGKPIVRASMADEASDPFALDNSLSVGGKNGKSVTAQALLSNAEAKFSQQKYQEARALFAQAYSADTKILAVEGTGDRWAYCKFKFVVDQLNQAQPALSLPDLEGEVKSALALKPNAKVSLLGTQLLQQIAQRQTAAGTTNAGGAAQVKHLTKTVDGWQVAETAHFRIYHNQQLEFVEQVAQVAEQTRTKMTYKWFGASAKAWRDRCDIYLHATAAAYGKKTGVNPQMPGHSRIETDNGTGEVVCRQIELHCDNPDLLTAILPHEGTHVILAGQFGTQQVPRWVDEGVAVLTEPTAKINLHLDNLGHFQQEQELFHVGELIEMKDYPQQKSRIGAFYAQSVSLVGYLAAQRGPMVFTQFVRDGMLKGYEAALRTHYGIQSYNELNGRWMQHALATGIQSPGYAQK